MTIHKLMENISSHYTEEAMQEREDLEESRLLREKGRLEIRRKNLVEMRMDGELDKESFLAKKEEIEERLEEIRKLLQSVNKETKNISTDEKDTAAALDRIRKALEESADLEQKFLDEDLIEQSVVRVVPYEGSMFKWYMDIGREPMENSFSESDYVLYKEFTISFEEARAYRKQYGNYIRKRQWNDLDVQVYFRVL